MADLLLTTKFHIPPARPNLISRPRLFEQLDEALAYPLVIASAAPGFGKTTIVSEWIRRRSSKEARRQKDHVVSADGPTIRVAWLALTDDDNDVTRFLTYLSIAINSWSPSLSVTTLGLLGLSELDLNQLVAFLHTLSGVLAMPESVADRTLPQQ